MALLVVLNHGDRSGLFKGLSESPSPSLIATLLKEVVVHSCGWSLWFPVYRFSVTAVVTASSRVLGSGTLVLKPQSYDFKSYVLSTSHGPSLFQHSCEVSLFPPHCSVYLLRKMYPSASVLTVNFSGRTLQAALCLPFSVCSQAHVLFVMGSIGQA